MANEEYTEVTSTSWFSRISNSLKGIIIGSALILAAIVLLFWNEGRAVRRYQTLKEGAGAVISVKSDAVDPSNEGRLVHMEGAATTIETLTDSDFGVSENAIKLSRSVEMYQWEQEEKSETRKKLGGGEETKTTYSYKKVWSRDLIDSSSFKIPEGHENPGALPYKSAVFTAKNVTLGAFTLSPAIIDQIGTFDPLPIAGGEDAEEGKPEPFQGGYYIGKDPAHPGIGDAKITFSVVRPQEISVISGQRGNTLEPYQFESGEVIELVQSGKHSAKAMFKEAQSANKLLTWILRLAGFVVMLAGFIMIFRIISVVGDIVPFVGDLLSVGTGLLSLLLSIVVSLVTIGIAWLFHRPLLGILLVVAAGGGVWLIRRKMKKGAAPAVAA